MTDRHDGPATYRSPILRSLSRALGLLWGTHRAYTLILFALTTLSGLLAPLHLWSGRCATRCAACMTS